MELFDAEGQINIPWDHFPEDPNNSQFIRSGHWIGIYFSGCQIHEVELNNENDDENNNNPLEDKGDYQEATQSDAL